MTVLTLENDALRAKVMPEQGAMVASLVDLERGREWLDQPRSGTARSGTLDSVYGGSEACGWDECFPTVNPVAYPEPPWEGVALTDHGELWPRPWSWSREDDALVTTIEGARLPYRFQRRLSLEGRSLSAEYELTNPSGSPLFGLWALHPLFRAAAGMRVVLSPGVDAVLCTYSSVERFVPGTEIPWHGLELLAPAEEKLALKLWTNRLESGRASLVAPDGASVALEWDVSTLPYLGLWLNEGGWPSGNGERYHVAFEPCAARADDLLTALERQEALHVPPGRTRHWAIRIVVT